MPKQFSFSQIKSYRTCPYQYKLGSIIKIPTKNNHYFAFGNTIHNTLQEFYEGVQQMNTAKQESLFGVSEKKKDTDGIKAPSEEDLLKIYNKRWNGDWFLSKKQREDYYEDGKRMLKKFYEDNKNNWTVPISLEGGFKIKIGDYLLRGRIDRIDQLANGSLEIIDYKTGKAKEKVIGDDKDQLLLYQIVTETLTEYRNIGNTSKLTFYYVKDGIKTDFIGKPEELDELKGKIEKTIDKIQKRDFKATPNKRICGYCSFRDVCEFRV